MQAEKTSSDPTGADRSLIALQSQLELSNAQLHATEAELESSRQRLRESQLEIDKLKHRIDWLCRKLFGKSSEKVDPSQLALAFEQLAVEDAAVGTADAGTPEEDGPVETDSGEPRGRGKKKGHGRSALPAHLPRRRVVVEVPAEERTCSCCQREMTPFGEDVKLTLDYEPARITVVETVRVKYSCSKCHEGVVIAPAPDAVMDKGLPEAGMLSYVAVSKYADHLPLYRLERVLARSGLVISRNTLGDWIDFIADSFSAVIEAMKKKILKGPIVQSDDTKIRVLGGPEGSYAGYLWCYGGLHDEVVFDFTEGRGREGPLRFLDGYQGYLQVDAYAGYDAVFARGHVVEVACWAHARRKIFEARTTDPKHADPLLGMIAALYAVEADAKGLAADERRALRVEKSRPLLARIHERLLQARGDALPKSPMGQAVTYALNQWTGLQRYLEDGRLAIDNNATERSLRGVAVGRKNWLFTGSEAGGRRAAVLYSIIESCRRLHVDPFAYIRDVLPRLASHLAREVEQLTPAGWKIAFPEAAASAVVPAAL
ncbi:MAG TPA: IS66 family transposase [Steroidobacteraceae bacterium]|nr:IS66 family transposase [Steroidobacteraceae bacterium]